MTVNLGQGFVLHKETSPHFALSSCCRRCSCEKESIACVAIRHYCNTAVHKPALDAREAYMLESDEKVLGEPLPLSVLLLVAWGVSSAAAVIDMIRSSSGKKDKCSQFIQTDRRIDPNV